MHGKVPAHVTILVQQAHIREVKDTASQYSIRLELPPSPSPLQTTTPDFHVPFQTNNLDHMWKTDVSLFHRDGFQPVPLLLKLLKRSNSSAEAPFE